MSPESPLRHRSDPAAPDTDDPFVSEETLVLRNYDSDRSHDVTVRFLDAEGEVAFRQTYTLSPLAVVSVSLRLQRAVYQIAVRMDEERATSTECLIGSGPDETALVEVGNGLVSVAEGVC